MGRKLAFLCGLITFMFSLVATPAEAGFLQQAEGDRVMLAEVQSYGDYELKPAFFQTLADKLAQLLSEQKVPLVYCDSADMTNENGRHSTGNASGTDETLSRIHMDAIVRGHQFNYGFAAAKLIRYADAAVGRKHFYDDAAVKAWREQPTQLYHLTPAVQDQAQRVAKQNGAKYLLFVNVKDVDVRLKHTMFATHTERETRGKKMKAALDYYIVNTETGKVYEGHCDNKKTAQMLNLAIVQTGKGMSVDEMLNQVMEAQAGDVTNDFCRNGFPAVKS